MSRRVTEANLKNMLAMARKSGVVGKDIWVLIEPFKARYKVNDDRACRTLWALAETGDLQIDESTSPPTIANVKLGGEAK